MAPRRRQKAGDDDGDAQQGKPAFPYTTKPGTLRKFLDFVPKKPRPTKINLEYLKGLGFRDSNDQTIIRVLKSLGLVGENSNEPTPASTEFMKEGSGPAALGKAIRKVYAPLFEHSHQPHKEADDVLRNYFNISSGGSKATMSLQIQTFKALCDHAVFAGTNGSPAAGLPIDGSSTEKEGGSGRAPTNGPAIHIDLHIHLPENKSSRDYEYILQDIAKYIYGRDIGGRKDTDG